MTFIGDFNKMFSALKGLMNRVWDFIPWPTSQNQQRALTSLRTNVSQEIKNTEKKVRKRLTDEQRRLREYEARQKRLDRERKRAANAEKKVVRERTLRNRLLTDSEKNSLIHRLETEAMSNDQRQVIEKKLKDSKLETTRRKKQTGYKGPKKKVTDLKSVFERGVTVEQTGNGADGMILKFQIKPRGSNMTVNNFLIDAKHEVLRLMREYNNNYKFQMVLHTKVKRQRLLGNDTDTRDIFTSSRNFTFDPNTDFDEVYDEASTMMSRIFYKKEHEGSGWTLEKIYHLELKFYRLTKTE